MKNKILIWITLAIALVAVIVVIFLNQSQVDVEIAEEHQQTPSIEGQPILGEADAPVTVIEFGDYKCPSCKAWDETVFPLLKEEYIDTGIVNFVHINTPFHGEESILAALASESMWHQNEDDFWEYHKEIYQNQPPTQQHDEPWITQEKLIDIASSINSDINLEQLANDIENESYMDNVLIDMELVEEFGVTQTPTIMVNHYQLNNPFEYEHLVRLIEMEE
ncbi:DsbA family protein [Bacillus sp. JCM 19041]|uniref:DsbA family protein n=1 Tax=Bacillus sp. JCM 19041 TaxID=1460637 RepID=UPI0006D01998